MIEANDRGRPAANQTASNVTSGDETSVPTSKDIVRCSKCGHGLTAQKSVDLELGPVCRRVAGEVA